MLCLLTIRRPRMQLADHDFPGGYWISVLDSADRERPKSKSHDSFLLVSVTSMVPERSYLTTIRPLIFGYNVQFFSVGVLMGGWCFLTYIQSPIENFRARDMRLTDLSYTATVLPVMLLTFYLPHFVSLSAWIDPQTRHAANWIWQPFAIWTTILQYTLKKTVMPDTIQEDRIKNPSRDLPVIKYTIYSLCAISAATWWYTLYNAPFSPVALFFPNVAAMKTNDEFIRLFLQFDEVFAMGAGFLWLLYLFGDLKRAGMLESSWLSIVGRGLVTLVAAGPGVTIGLGWWWREQLLATKWHKDAVVAGKSK